jgi:hypothetical protein
MHEADQIMTHENENIRKIGGMSARENKCNSEDISGGIREKSTFTGISLGISGFFLFRKPPLGSRVAVDDYVQAPAAGMVGDTREIPEGVLQSTKQLEDSSITNSNGKRADISRGSSKLLQIKTIPDGFNSGRTYYVRFNSNVLCCDIVLELSSKANEARNKLLKLSQFQKQQEAVRIVFTSKYFQSTVAFLIFLVRISTSFICNDSAFNSPILIEYGFEVFTFV